MLLSILRLLIDVTFSTPTGCYVNPRVPIFGMAMINDLIGQPRGKFARDSSRYDQRSLPRLHSSR